MKYFIAIVSILFASSLSAHEWTPTYPVARQSFLSGVMQVTMTLVNRREDIRFYEVEVFDEEFNPVEFNVSGGNIINIEYTSRATIDIYFSRNVLDEVEYICTASKSLIRDAETSTVKSRICSRLKRE